MVVPGGRRRVELQSRPNGQSTSWQKVWSRRSNSQGQITVTITGQTRAMDDPLEARKTRKTA